MMKIALVGSNGYIAGFLHNRFSKEKCIEKILKIDQSENADEFLSLERPEIFNYCVLEDVDFVIFTAAISGPDKCATDFKFCWNINVVGTKYFIHEAINRKCKILFFSSDAVFGNMPGYIYDENSETKAITPYGKMKKAIEDEFKDSEWFKCIRLSYVASTKDRFVSYCLECIDKKEAAEIFHPFYRNCVVVSDVVEVVYWLVIHWDEFSSFVLNVAGKELVSRVRIADELNRCLGNKLNYTIVKPSKEFYNNRPPITQMKSVYLSQYNILEDNTFTEKIAKELKEIS